MIEITERHRAILLRIAESPRGAVVGVRGALGGPGRPWPPSEDDMVALCQLQTLGYLWQGWSRDRDRDRPRWELTTRARVALGIG